MASETRKNYIISSATLNTLQCLFQTLMRYRNIIGIYPAKIFRAKLCTADVSLQKFQGKSTVTIFLTPKILDHS